MTPMSTLTRRRGYPLGRHARPGLEGRARETGRAESWPVAREWARQAERLGFHGIWVFDHFQPYPARDDSPVLEAWTTLAALSQATERIVLGTLVSCAAYRPAAMTVKMAENLHALSGGGSALAWARDGTSRSSGSSACRSLRRRSDPIASKRLSAHAAPRGVIFRCVRVRPMPVAQGPAGRPLLLVGGAGEKRTLPAAAAYADAVNWQVGVEEFARKSRCSLACVSRQAATQPASAGHTPRTSSFSTASASSPGGGKTSGGG